jgi:hypothetical protein
MKRGAVEANIFTTQFDEDFKGIFRQAALGRRTNSERLGISVYELDPECRASSPDTTCTTETRSS